MTSSILFNSIGLIADIIGAWLLYHYGLPEPLSRTGAGHLILEQTDEAEKANHSTRWWVSPAIGQQLPVIASPPAPMVPEAIDLPELLRNLASASALLLGLTYISGFLIVRIHLGRMGIVQFGLLSVEYLVAGTLFLCAVALVWVPVWTGEMIARTVIAGATAQGEPLKKIVWNGLAGRAIGIMPGWFLGGVVLYYLGVKTNAIVFWIVITFLPYLFLSRRYERAKILLHQAPAAVRFPLHSFAMFILVLVGLCVTFGTQIYPQIDHWAGGGSPVRLELEFETPSADMGNGPYDVLAVTNQHWILRDTTGGTHHHPERPSKTGHPT